jgi:hypothetical protein
MRLPTRRIDRAGNAQDHGIIDVNYSPGNGWNAHEASIQQQYHHPLYDIPPFYFCAHKNRRATAFPAAPPRFSNPLFPGQPEGERERGGPDGTAATDPTGAAT